MYDFDTPVNRFGTNSLKWDIKENELPMWVADMDFKAADEIIDAMKERIDNGVFGYSIIPDEWADAYVKWWSTRHNFTIEPEWLVFCTGVVPAISSAVRKLTTPGEKVLIQTPVYNIFYNSILNNGRNVLESKLAYDGVSYSIDWQQLEKDLSDPQVSLMILCNPQNPAGKIWDKDTLAGIGELCKKYGVTVVSDEIHCDITEPGREYTPFASASDICKDISITCIAATKCFNLAGTQSAAVFAANPVLRHKIWRALNTDEVGEPNFIAIQSTIAAFEKGGAWLDEMREYVFENKRIVEDFVAANLPELHVVPSDATYLLWIDCNKITDSGEKLADFIREKTGLFVSDGEQYGNTGAGFLRMNVACPRATVNEGLARFKKGVDLFVASK